MSDYDSSISAGITAAAQLAAPAVSSAWSWKYTKKAMKLQNKYNLEMWNMQNEYNSPQAQMQRFQQAGLNPNLIYGQGTPGNASSAPQQVTGTPDMDHALSGLAKAFNIENLRTLVANRKKAEADAQSASIDAANAKDQREATYDMGVLYSFNPLTGRYEFNESDSEVVRPMSKYQRYLKDYTGSATSRQYYFNLMRENQYRNLQLIPFREALMKTQRNYLVPQITMANYEASHYPISYWIGQGTKVGNTLLSIPKAFSPLNWGYRKSTVQPTRIENNSYKNYYIHRSSK